MRCIENAIGNERGTQCLSLPFRFCCLAIVLQCRFVISADDEDAVRAWVRARKTERAVEMKDAFECFVVS